MTRGLAVLLFSLTFLTEFFGRTMRLHVKVASLLNAVLAALPLIMLLPLWFSRRSDKVRRCFEDLIVLAVFPYVCATVYTSILLVMNPKDYMLPMMLSSWVQVIWTVYRIVLACLLCLRFREDTVDMLSEAAILAYAVIMSYAFVHIGLGGIVRYLTEVPFISTSLNSYFEYNDVGLSLGMLILYRLFLKRTQFDVGGGALPFCS